MSNCCKEGFKWEGKPTGKETTLAGNKAYVTGKDTGVAILIVHDIFGWTFNNTRLLADHYAEEVGATVYLPDFFGGEVVSEETMEDPKKREAFDIMGFLGKNGKEIRFPEIKAAAEQLRKDGFKKIGAIGFCYGGWAVFQLGAKGANLVDAISTAHPSILTNEEIDNIAVSSPSGAASPIWCCFHVNFQRADCGEIEGPGPDPLPRDGSHVHRRAQEVQQ